MAYDKVFKERPFKWGDASNFMHYMADEKLISRFMRPLSLSKRQLPMKRKLNILGKDCLRNIIITRMLGWRWKYVFIVVNA